MFIQHFFDIQVIFSVQSKDVLHIPPHIFSLKFSILFIIFINIIIINININNDNILIKVSYISIYYTIFSNLSFLHFTFPKKNVIKLNFFT